MKTFASLIVLVLLFGTGSMVAAEDVQVSDPFPDGYVLNPANSDDTLLFGDVQASIVSIDESDEGNRTVSLEIVNNSRVTLWVSTDMLKSFTEGRFNGDAGTDSGEILFEATSMESTDGRADVAYEWFMAIPGGSTGVVHMEMDPAIEKLCYQPFNQNQSGLTNEDTQQIHGCWLLTTPAE